MLDFSSEAGLRLKSLLEENFLYDLVDACHVCARACSAVTSVFFLYRECKCVLLFIYILFLRFEVFSPCIRADLSFIVRFIISRCHISLRISREFGFKFLDSELYNCSYIFNFILYSSYGSANIRSSRFSTILQFSTIR